ncbi:TetR/AcrR family transcriptional regulator [Saccharomonospora xinjiangensis]|uniref:TetR/AcrR family transcriptional regulator n=1 Tax=Saccharomonospora xinjiangensis TaxID=75294 RepID=UPI00350FD29C
MDVREATTRVLDAADEQFYERGIQAVGMDAIRSRSGVSLKRLYQCFPSKDHIVAAYLRRRDERWREELAEYVRQHGGSGRHAVLAVFDWLSEWFRRPEFRGCAFVNSFGELGGVSPVVAEAARAHKKAVGDYLRELTGSLDVSDPDGLAAQLAVLVEGAIVMAAVTGDLDAARTGRACAEAAIATAAR